uniref:Uncharacterized protein n=1 Tax=Arion vulgaris TaxID=1028688 RepID=A0A0B6ZLL8_9EUPU
MDKYRNMDIQQSDYHEFAHINYNWKTTRFCLDHTANFVLVTDLIQNDLNKTNQAIARLQQIFHTGQSEVLGYMKCGIKLKSFKTWKSD